MDIARGARTAAGSVRTQFGDWFERMGAIGGGETIAPDTLLLRFDNHTDAAAASASLVDALAGVKLVVAEQDGRPVQGGTGSGNVADLLMRVPGVLRVQQRRVPESALVVTSLRPDTNARLDAILRDEILGLPVRWSTSGS